MTLLAIKDDFLQRSLAKIPGLFDKLGYLAQLRENGRYVHWGLQRVYGEEAAQRAVAEVHRGLFMQVLRMPLHRILDDVTQSASAQHTGVRQYLQTVLQTPHSLVPPNVGGGSEAHFNSVVAALWSLIP